MERKYIPLAEFKAVGDPTGPGELIGYPSKFYDIDSYRDIVLPGCFLDSLPAFRQSGFTCQSHDWGYEGVIGYPVAAEEDAVGLLSTTRFHSTPDAQNVRTKAMERLAAGLSVGLSIGFRTQSEQWIEAEVYETELPKYIPADKLLGVMDKVKSLPNVRLLQKAELYEYSIVTAPALTSAQVLEMRGEARFKSADEVKATVLASLRSTMPLEWHSDAVRAAVEGLTERYNALIEQRAGRVISESNMGTLHTARAAMDDACAALDAVIAAAQPKASQAESDALRSRLIKQRFRLRPLLAATTTTA